MGHLYTYFSPTSSGNSSDGWYKPLIGDSWTPANKGVQYAYDGNPSNEAGPFGVKTKNSTGTVWFNNFTTIRTSDSIKSFCQLTSDDILGTPPPNSIMSVLEVRFGSGFNPGIGDVGTLKVSSGGLPEGYNLASWTPSLSDDGKIHRFQTRLADFANLNDYDQVFSTTPEERVKNLEITLAYTDGGNSVAWTQWSMDEIGVFAIILIPIRLNSVINGQRGNESQLQKIDYNENAFFTFSPNAGYNIEDYVLTPHIGVIDQFSVSQSNNTLNVSVKGTRGADFSIKFNPITYTIGYNLNGGSLPSGTSNPTTYNVEANEITLVEPTKTGYTFKGWSGTGLSGDSNKNVKIPKGSTGNRTYTANWIPTTYTISYTLNGSNPYTVDTISNPISYNIETNTITLNNPTRKGYTFKGWSGTGLTGDTNKNVTIPKGSMENRDYTANWIENYIYFEYWSNNRTEDNKKFITWKASPQNSSIGWPDNHYDFTASVNKQTYPGYKAKPLKGYSSGGYYNTKPDGSGAYSVHESYNFSSYLDMCDKYGVDYYEPATTIPIYCQWTPEILVSYDTIFNYFDWYRNEIKPDYQCSIISQNENEFTIKSNADATDGYSKQSPVFNLAKENNESGNLQVIEDYIIEVDTKGSGWQLFIFFLDDDGKEVYYPGTSYHHTNISRSGAKITIPPGATKARIRVDSNASENQVTFSNFRIYPAKYYYMGYTVSESERIDRNAWSLPTNPTRGNNFYKFKGWSKDPGLNGKDTLVDTSSFPKEDTVLFSQWDKKAPRIFIQEAAVTGGKAAPIALLHNKPIRKAFIYTTDTNKWREC